MKSINMYFTDDDILEVIDSGRYREFLLIDWGGRAITTFVDNRLSSCLKRLFLNGYINRQTETIEGDVWKLTELGKLHLQSQK